MGPLIYHHLYPDSSSVGIEFEKSRLEVSQRLRNELRSTQVEFIHADLCSAEIPIADLYFLYFPTGPVLDRILDKIGDNPNTFLLIAIESHGDLFDRLDQETWLEVYKTIPLQSPRHSPYARIYRKHKMKLQSTFHDYSFQERYFKIQREDGKIWVGDSFGMTWLQKGFFNLASPPTTICLEDVKTVHTWEELDGKLQLLIKLRRLGHLDTLKGSIRKIFIHPTLQIELSTGKLIECDERCLKDLATTYSEGLK